MRITAYDIAQRFVGTKLVLGGNQSDQVSVAPFGAKRILGIRRLREGS